MAKGKLTISIDLEFAWGVWDHLTPDLVRLVQTTERSICEALVTLFDRYEVPSTWAMVAALLDAESARGRPGGTECWYAPDVVDRLIAAKVAHEIGSHSGRHPDFTTLDAESAANDVSFAAAIHHKADLPFRSFVFPRNAVAHLETLSAHGIRAYRGPDVTWASALDRVGLSARRAANLADKMLPVPPSTIVARRRDLLIDIPGSMLLLGRDGMRRFVLPQITRAKLAMGLDRARRRGEVFHFWFHPSNFYYRREEQLATLEWFLARASDEAGRGNIELRTMGTYAVL